MAKSITVTTEGAKSYEICLRHDFSELAGMLRELGYQRDQKVCIVTDSNVSPLYADEVRRELSACFDTVMTHVFSAGEEQKNLATVETLYEFLIVNRFDRRDLLVALGGGVTGDLTGFAAATYLRGIDFIQVPTTLLAQVDSSIGGKTGVDFLQYKNMVGAFYQPGLVYMNLATLATLPEKQIVSGMGEIIKHGLIKDAGYFRWLTAQQEAIAALQPAAMEEMIWRSCLIKREVVERDPKEMGERALLNFGHTIGHAIEKLSGFSLTHGECVGLGAIAAAYLSAQTGTITKDVCDEIEACFRRFGFADHVGGLSASEVLNATKSDKKMVGNRVKFILLTSVGNAYICRDLSDEQLMEGIAYVCR